jgi:C1A family cysteine protease
MKKEVALSFFLSCLSLTALAGEKSSLRKAVGLYQGKKIKGKGKPKKPVNTYRSNKKVDRRFVSFEELIGSKRLKEMKNRKMSFSSSSISNTFLSIKKDVDLSYRDTPAKDQQILGSCTAFAMISAMENKINDKNVNLSEGHLWSLYKAYSIEEAINAAQSNYITSEEHFPYRTKRDFEGNPVLVDTSKRNFESRRNAHTSLVKYNFLGQSLSKALKALDRGNPVLLGKSITEDMLYNKKFLIGANSPLVKKGEKHAGHALSIVGYELDKKVKGGGFLKVKNSWGTDVGKRGYHKIPFNHCRKDMRGLCYMWSVSEVESDFLKKEKQFDPRNIKVAVKTSPNLKDSSKINFSLSLNAPTEILDRIEKVTYDIHPTFGKNASFEAKIKKGKFKTVTYISYATGWKTEGTEILFKNGDSIKLKGSVIPKPKKVILSTKDFGLRLKGIRSPHRGTRFILFLKQNKKGAFSQVKKVTYNIHPTFGRQSLAVSKNKNNSFKTPVYQTFYSGWKTRGAVIELKDGRKLQLKGIVIPK